MKRRATIKDELAVLNAVLDSGSELGSPDRFRSEKNSIHSFETGYNQNVQIDTV